MCVLVYFTCFFKGVLRHCGDPLPQAHCRPGKPAAPPGNHRPPLAPAGGGSRGVAGEGDTAKEGACFCHEVKVTWFSCVPHAPPLSSHLSPLSCARGGVPHELAAISNSISGDPSVETRQKPKRGGRQRICTFENAEFLFCPEEQPGALGRRAKPRAINRIAGYNWFFDSFRYGITGSPDPTSSDRAAWWVTP